MPGPDSSSAIDAYLDHLRVERRLARLTVESYSHDLVALARFAEAGSLAVERLSRQDLEAFVRRLMSSGLSPRSTARAVACVRGFYRFLVLDRQLDASPADDLRAPRAWPALPRFLSIEEVDRLLDAPDVTTPRGLRDRAMIELLYATGLRVSELVGLRAADLNLEAGYLTCTGKGDKQRMRVHGGSGRRLGQRIHAGRPGRRCSGSGRAPRLFVNVRGGGLTRVGFWKRLRRTRRGGRSPAGTQPARAAPLVCDTPARAAAPTCARSR